MFAKIFDSTVDYESFFCDIIHHSTWYNTLFNFE